MPQRLPKREDLVNVPEFEDVASNVLEPPVFATIAGGDRAGFDRITFRPRLMVPTIDMDLSVDLFGQTHFTPLLVGPVANQRRYHADGELATVRGASAARVSMIVSSQAGAPLAQIAAQAATPLWFSVYAEDNARMQIDQAIAAGCTVVCIAVQPSTVPDFKKIASIARGLSVPVVMKGVMTPEEASAAIAAGARGIVVSDHGVRTTSRPTPIEAVPAIVDACAGRAAVLVDGSFRRGSDVAKALALGARAVMVARPIMWGLAAYGANGVQNVLELLQSELARTLGSLGAPDLTSLTRAMVRIHQR